VCIKHIFLLLKKKVRLRGSVAAAVASGRVSYSSVQFMWFFCICMRSTLCSSIVLRSACVSEHPGRKVGGFP